MVVVIRGDASTKNATLKYSESTLVKSTERGAIAIEHDDLARALRDCRLGKRNTKITFYLGPLIDT